MIKRPLCLAAVLILVVQVFLTGGLFAETISKPSLLEQMAEDGDMLELQGRVYRREERPKYQMLYLTENQIRLKDQVIKVSNILVQIERKETQKSKSMVSEIEYWKIGNVIRVTGEVRFFESASNPGNFDRKFYYQKQGICASVWADDAEIAEDSVWQVREWLAGLRSRWKKLLVSSLGEYYGNCMSAILLGDKSELDPEVKDLYQKSGIGHILAISGLHMSFIGIGLYQLLRKAGLSFIPAGGVGILFLLGYTLMIGSGVSSQRALVMFIVRVGADMAGRDYDLPSSLSLAAAVIVIRQPLYLYDAGFLLSFGALLGIAAVNPVLETERFRWIPKPVRASLAIHLTLLPILLYYYFEIPPYSLLLNLLVIPLMSAVLGAGVLGSIAAVIWADGGSVILQICRCILWLYEKTAVMTMGLPFGRLVLGQPRKWWMAVYYVVLFGGCAWWQWKGRKREQGGGMQKKKVRNDRGIRVFLVCISPIMLIFVFCIGCAAVHGKDGELRVTMIDVGQGDGLYVRTISGKHYLIDGGSTSESQVGTYRIEPFLKSQGVGRLDYVFLSHGDADHISGIREMLEDQDMGIRIDTLVFPAREAMDEKLWELAEVAEANGTTAVTMQAGQEIVDGSMHLRCLAPSAEYAGEIGNASSMVLELQYGEFEMLFTGDLEGEGEASLLQDARLKDYDVLKVAHHGSKNATSVEMLDQISPEIALVSAGKENRYGHPHDETIQRLEAVESRIYCTIDSGAVTITTDGEKMRVETFVK